MLETKQGRFFTAAEKYQILEDLEKWMEETGSKNTFRFAKERGLSVGSIYNWVKFKRAGVPLEDSLPKIFVKGDERIDRGHAVARHNAAIKRGAVNPARQHIKPNQNQEEKLEAGRERARQYRERERQRRFMEQATHPMAPVRGSWPDETTKTYWAQALFRARVLGRAEVKRVKANFASQTGLFPDTINVWARKYSLSEEGKRFVEATYSGRGPIHQTPTPGTFPEPPAPVKPPHFPMAKPAPAPVGNGIDQHAVSADFKPLAAAIETFAKALQELGLRFSILDGRVNELTSAVYAHERTGKVAAASQEALAEEVHKNTSSMAKALKTLAEIETYFR